MSRTINLALGLAASLWLAGAVDAAVTLNSVRVGAQDVEALGRFYEAAFGLKETNRLTIGTGVEIFLKFGDTVEAAQANPQAQIVIMPSEPLSVDDPIAHVIFNVTDMDATVAAVKAAGGSIDREPREFGNTGIVISFAVDPAGNRIELIQPRQR